ncbi:MAG TPA: branched-chain-amino-acid transaminase [Patescibacteria group bacterium]|nr:branched-chain-amino-acid transaminase [Patescibacteria group bacterium]
MESELQVYIDGNFYPKSEAKISVFDHGLLYGDGIFEGIRAYDGIVFKLKEHIDRLYRSAHMIMLPIPIDREEMIERTLETLRRNKLKDAYIRLVVTRGKGDLGLNPRRCPKPTIIIITDSIMLHGNDAKENGVVALISWVKRDPVDATSHEIKSLNYLNSILAKLEANIWGVDEAIVLDKNGFVCEGVAENIFMVKNGKLCTPPTYTGALHGITAQAVQALAKKLGYDVEETIITPFQLFNADEVFFTGTASEIIPLREINKRQINDGKPGPITKRLQAEFAKLIRDPREGITIYR